MSGKFASYIVKKKVQIYDFFTFEDVACKRPFFKFVTDQNEVIIFFLLYELNCLANE